MSRDVIGKPFAQGSPAEQAEIRVLAGRFNSGPAPEPAPYPNGAQGIVPKISVVLPTAEDEILRILNSEPLRQDQYEAFVSERLLGREGEPFNCVASLLGLDIDSFLRGLGISSQRKAGEQVITRRLRSLVDEWLATGVDESGCEFPARRNVFRTSQALKAMHELANEPGLFRLVLLPEHSEMFITVISRHGESQDWLFAQAAEERAKRLFMRVVLSDWKVCLCRCRYHACGRYFNHPKPRSSYRSGTFCSREHASRAAARNCTRQVRAEAPLVLIKEAARILSKWKAGSTWSEDARIKRRLTGALNEWIAHKGRYQGRRDPVKINWVTRNRVAIERKRNELTPR